MAGCAARPTLCVLERDIGDLRRQDGKIAKRIYTTIYEIDCPGAIATPEFQAMRGWYQFAPHVRSRTQVIVLTG